jgi:hypothetical protein
MGLFDDIPGYREAVEKEQTVRDAAFLPVNESIGGFEVRSMTLPDFMLFRMMKSPLLTFSVPTPAQLSAFLWLLSPDYTPQGGDAKKRFFRRCRQFTLPAKPTIRNKWFMRCWMKKAQARMKVFANVIADARRYVIETFQDRPASVPTVQDETDYYSDATSICGSIAREYGWTEAAILKIPLKRLFQYMKEIGEANGKKVLFNPSDQVKAEWQLEQNRLAQRN